MGAVHTQDQWPGLSVAIFWPMRIYGPMRTYRQYWIFVQITRQPPDRRLALYWTCDYLPMLGFKVNPCSPKRPSSSAKPCPDYKETPYLVLPAVIDCELRYWSDYIIQREASWHFKSYFVKHYDIILPTYYRTLSVYRQYIWTAIHFCNLAYLYITIHKANANLLSIRDP